MASSIKNRKVYNALRTKRHMSKQMAAAISNALAGKGKGKSKKR
jgi:hypothetical protein